MPAPAAPQSGRTLGSEWAELLALAVILVLAVLPLLGVAGYVGLTELRRWAWTEPVFAVAAIALAICWLRSSMPAALVVVVVAGVAVLAGSSYDMWIAFARPGEDDYISAELVLGGFFAMAVTAAVGILVRLSLLLTDR